MGVLTEFQCPNRVFSKVLKVGSPTASSLVFPELVNHIKVSTDWMTSGLVGVGFVATPVSGLYLPINCVETFDVTVGSVSFFGTCLGSLHLIGMN